MNTYTVHNNIMLQTCVVIRFMRDYDPIQTLAKYVVCMYVGITFSL